MEKFIEDIPVATALKCFHCSQDCEETFTLDDKVFCCYGCKTVYEILSANNLCDYYTLDRNPGVSVKDINDENFAYLDEKNIRKKFLSFDSEGFAKATFFTPAIHCVSCIWLLESLQKIEKGILRSQVNFAKKSVTIDFNPDHIKLSRLASLLSSVGYTPQIHLDSKTENKVDNKSLVIKLTVAGFCFGNIMLLSFPEYLGLDQNDRFLMRVFSWLNLVLALPVFFYSATDYLKSALNSFKQKEINIDVPIAVGLIALFFRSSYDIISHSGPGYLDSFAGLVFFLLIGRWFQSKTYESLAFDRDYKSYFPLAVHKLAGGQWKPVIIHELNCGDQIRIRNMEIIPADSTLTDDFAYIDYSFVTGESRPVKVKQGEQVYAGGRLVGQPVILVVNQKTLQSHLTSLWNNAAFSKVTTSKYKKIIDRAARNFTWVVLAIAALTAVYWQITSPSQMWLVLTAVLMVACPCALALSAPFTYGSMQRVFGRNQFYLKNADVIERLALVDSVVFDKTGTVTHGDKPKVDFIGNINKSQLAVVKLLTGSSTHPLSILISKSITEPAAKNISDFKEIPGKGIEAMFEGSLIKVGSSEFVIGVRHKNKNGSNVFVAIDNKMIGYFTIRTTLRKNIKTMIDRLGAKCAGLLSGDNDADRIAMHSIFNKSMPLLFNQTPHDKLNYIKDLQQNGKTVLMVGDGLNDSGALKQSDVGVTITDDTGVFAPACDGILNGKKLNLLDKYLELAKASSVILKISFVISFFYNAVALSFAVTGHLTPLVAAILMPISSISVVSFSTLAVNFIAKRKLPSIN